MGQTGQTPSIDDVIQAAAALQGHIVKTPVITSAALDAIAGAELFLKAECMQHIGAFKARGAMFAVQRLSEGERAKGVITYSSGNHAQAVALAAKRFAIRCDVAMPEDAPPIKVASVLALGAKVVFAGLTSDDRKARALEIQAETGGVIIQPFDHPHIVAGQGTATLELCRAVPDLDAIVVPVGGGGLIGGACIVAADRGIKVIAVEPRGCDAMAQSIEAGRRIAVQPAPTIADGLKPVRVGALNFAIAKRHLFGCVRVDDEQIGRTLSTLLLHAKVMVEPSGAAALAAALCGLTRQIVPGADKIGVILSGGNFALDNLAAHITAFAPY